MHGAENPGGGSAREQRQMFGCSTVTSPQDPGKQRREPLPPGSQPGQGDNKILRGDSSPGPRHPRSYFKALSRRLRNTVFSKRSESDLNCSACKQKSIPFREWRGPGSPRQLGQMSAVTGHQRVCHGRQVRMHRSGQVARAPCVR